jgi:nicotinic acid phosphoribosyltransferase
LLKKWDIDVQINPVGTHAHELSMVMSQLFPELDRYNIPLTQILGHYLYFKLCNIRQGRPMKIPMLPDTLGTPSFMVAAKNIDIGGESFLSKCIVAARQDSGSLEGFVKVMDSFECKVPIMASEIDNRETFDKALTLRSPVDGRFPYANFGAGGFFGDSPKVWGYGEFYLSMAVKPVRVFVGGRTGYPVKLGDSDYTKSQSTPGKISIDGTLDEHTYGEIVGKANLIKNLGIRIMNDERVEIQNLSELFTRIILQLGVN